ncbi:MAG: protein kinase [Proteobacteria bacterium]|nr:protein kinase [Pseudomonadota bacterium]
MAERSSWSPAGAQDAGTLVDRTPTDDDRTLIAPPTRPRTVARIAAETLPGSAAAAAPPDGIRQVGRYQVMETLGRGGMATVFRARDPGIGRDLALKFLHVSLCEDPEYRARFVGEAQAAGRLSHPNIVTVHDVGEIEGRPYMAMELLDGVSLAAEMQPGQPMPVRDVAAIGIQLACALDYAHARGIVHRDIKPGNLMRLKGSDTIKVTDFGIAHIETTDSAHRTRVGDVLGTPQYMSPEQALGRKLDGRSDLFSAGIVLYQMLTGQRPFQGDSTVALAVNIAREEPVPIEKVRADLPASLRRVIERCLQKAPERRYQTGAELADALTRCIAEIDAAARERPRIVPLRVKWAGMMALIVLVVSGLAAAVITQRQYAAMIDQVSDNGAALARFIAAQNATAVLGDDWVSVDVALQIIMKTGDFRSIAVADAQGVVRAASDAALVGKPYAPPAGAVARGARPGGVVLTHYAAGPDELLGFQAPIYFQSKKVGGVALALPERPLLQVARLSIALMAVLVVVTVLAVAVAMYFVANWTTRPIALLEEAMGEVARGRLDHRIGESRRDEFGLLYAAFDRMAQALQRRPAVTAATAGGSAATRDAAAQ